MTIFFDVYESFIFFFRENALWFDCNRENFKSSVDARILYKRVTLIATFWKTRLKSFFKRVESLFLFKLFLCQICCFEVLEFDWNRNVNCDRDYNWFIFASFHWLRFDIDQLNDIFSTKKTTKYIKVDS